MPYRTKLKGKKSVHWWSYEIVDLRRNAIVARRRYQRAGRRVATEGRPENSLRELCKSVDDDPLGVPYKMVTKRLGRHTPAMDEHETTKNARYLFPALPPVEWDPVALGMIAFTILCELPEIAVPLFTREELINAANKLP